MDHPRPENPREEARQMQLPPEKRCNENEDRTVAEMSRFRPYLLMLARLNFDGMLQAKLSASDVVQQTLLEAHQSRASFRGRNDQEQAAWLRRILARNLADEVRKFRRRKRDVRLEQSIHEALSESTARLERWLASGEGTPSQCAVANEQLLALADALTKLPEDQRKAVEMHHLQGCPSALIAARLGRTEVAIAGLLRRGLKKLRETIRDNNPR
jgi:RNA polymerase sigma-70 factor, ECF subfamily